MQSASKFFLAASKVATGGARSMRTKSASTGGNDNPLILPSGLAAGLIASTGYLYTRDQDLFASKATTCESRKMIQPGKSSPDNSTSFRLLAALEMKDEVQRVLLAQILNDLHKIANEEQELKPQRRRMVRRLWQYVTSPFSDDSLSKVSAEGEISLKGVNLAKLKPGKARSLIEALKDGAKFDRQSLLTLLAVSAKSIQGDPTLVDLCGVSDNVSVVGDLHGSLQSLFNVLDLVGDIGGPDGSAVVFDGDFVDRGSESLEVLCTLLLLKLTYPRDVVLLRGNHEDALVSAAYGFQDEVIEKYGEDCSEIWDALSDVFCALPLCAVTDTAAILHGGLPSDNFSLTDIESITSETRSKIRTTMEPKDEVDTLVRNILWSDPTSRNGIRPNASRSVGVQFGPDVSRDFLERHNLRYLIRAHEVAEEGTRVLDCGGGRSVLTVFSQAAYPNGEGTNLGAIIRLNKDGRCHAVEFSSEEVEKSRVQMNKDPYVEALRSLIANNKNKLKNSFLLAEDGGFVTGIQWEHIMADTLQLWDVPWNILRSSVLPEECECDNDLVNWREFLRMYSSLAKGTTVDTINTEILKANHKMLLTVYKFLDVDGNGTVDLKEFKTGIDILNRRMPEDRKLRDVEALFHSIDKDGNGSIDLDEFEAAFKVL